MSIRAVLSAMASGTLETRLERLSVAIGASQAGLLEHYVALASSKVQLGTEVPVWRQDEIPLARRIRSGRKARWRGHPRPLDAVHTLGVHTTGVPGGFGVSQRQVRAWLPRAPELPDVDKRAWAHLMALRDRYTGLPYHSISSPAKEVVVNHKPTTYTWHGHGMNSYTWGHAVDDVWADGDHVAQFRVDHEICALLALHEHLKRQGVRLKHIECHSQHANKPRDPGEQMVERLLVPFARMAKLVIRRDVSSGRGQPLG